MAESQSQRRGRRTAGDPSAREQILIAARATFLENGYAGTSLREVAARADVDVALVSYYFRSKDNLFADAIGAPEAPASLVTEALKTPLEDLGRALVRQVLTAWGEPALATAMRGIVQRKVTNQDNWAELQQTSSEAILGPIMAAISSRAAKDAATHLHPAEVEYRAAMATGPIIGLIVLRYLVGVPAVAAADIEGLVDTVGAQVQRWLTGPLGGDERAPR